MLVVQVLTSDLSCLTFHRLEPITVILSFLKLFSFKKIFNIFFFLNISENLSKGRALTLKAPHNNRNFFFLSGHEELLYLKWNEHHLRAYFETLITLLQS